MKAVEALCFGAFGGNLALGAGQEEVGGGAEAITLPSPPGRWRDHPPHKGEGEALRSA